MSQLHVQFRIHWIYRTRFFKLSGHDTELGAIKCLGLYSGCYDHLDVKLSILGGCDGRSAVLRSTTCTLRHSWRGGSPAAVPGRLSALGGPSVGESLSSPARRSCLQQTADAEISADLYQMPFEMTELVHGVRFGQGGF